MPWFICQVHVASLQTSRIELPWLIVKHDSIMQVYVIYSKMHECIYRMKWHVDDSYYFKNITNMFSHKKPQAYTTPQCIVVAGSVEGWASPYIRTYIVSSLNVSSKYLVWCICRCDVTEMVADTCYVYLGGEDSKFQGSDEVLILTVQVESATLGLLL